MEGETSCPKRRSKISAQLKDQKNEINIKNKYNNDLIVEEENNEENIFNKNHANNDEEENLHYILNDYNNKYNYFRKFKIYFYLKINDNEFVFPIKTKIFNIKKHNGYDLIKNIIKKVNNNKIIININSIKYIVSLKDSENNTDTYNNFYKENYELKQYNIKNLKPKESFGYSPNILLKELVNEKICFVSKNPINIMLIEQYDNSENNFENKNYYNINNKLKNKRNYYNNFICNCFFKCFSLYNINFSTKNYIW